MIILFLMAGKGSRFKEKGYQLPKSLIDVQGKPMVAWAASSLAQIKPSNIIFACLKEHEQFGISTILGKLFGKNIHILWADKVTDGAASTALLAKDIINCDEELIISNTDQFFASPAFNEEIHKKKKHLSGLIPIFEATHPRWSFAKVNVDNLVIEVAEKVPISNTATVGVYYFKKGSDFVWACEQMMRKDIRRNNEFFICPTYNELIARGDKIKAIPTDFMWSLGTPEDIEYFNKYYKG